MQVEHYTWIFSTKKIPKTAGFWDLLLLSFRNRNILFYRAGFCNQNVFDLCNFFFQQTVGLYNCINPIAVNVYHTIGKPFSYFGIISRTASADLLSSRRDFLPARRFTARTEKDFYSASVFSNVGSTWRFTMPLPTEPVHCTFCARWFIITYWSAIKRIFPAAHPFLITMLPRRKSGMTVFPATTKKGQKRQKARL